MNQTAYRNIISGQDRRPAATVTRGLLACMSGPYSAAVRIRNGLYRCGILRNHTVPVPVISIGNLTTGGTGKTPLVIWLCRYLRQKKLRCAILTRGYKTDAGQLSDEPALWPKIARTFKSLSILIDYMEPEQLLGDMPARYWYLMMDFSTDDWLETLNILAVDATCPFGYEKLLPAGLLREPLGALKRADAVVITRFDLASAEQIAKIEKFIGQIAGPIPIARAVHRHTHAVTPSGQRVPLERLRQKKLFVYCGIGNPQAFVNCLTQDGMNVVGTKFFNDHYVYSIRDIRAIALQAAQCGAEMAICTQKDWVKTAAFCKQTGEINFGSSVMELEFVSDAGIIQTWIDHAVEQKSGKTGI